MADDGPGQAYKSFWSTLPGLLTALAGTIGAITALITALYQAGAISPSPPKAMRASPTVPARAEAAARLAARQHLHQGIVFASQKDYDNAILEFTQAMARDRAYAAAYANRGVAYMQQEKYHRALGDLQEAEKLDPRDKMVHYNLAALFARQNQVDRALDSLDRTLALGFNDYDALRSDPDLSPLRRSPEFRKVLERHKVFLSS